MTKTLSRSCSDKDLVIRYGFGNGHHITIFLTLHCAEPTENLADVPDDQIVETIETSDGPVASTVEHVHEIAKDVS